MCIHDVICNKISIAYIVVKMNLPIVGIKPMSCWFDHVRAKQLHHILLFYSFITYHV